MKTSKLFISAIILLLLSCQNEEPCTSYQLDKVFDVNFQETATFCDRVVSITFTKVTQDSRCPEDVVCIWQGLAEVELLIEVNGSEEKFLLSTFPTFQDVPSEVTFKGYIFKLEGVSPYPNTEVSHKEKDYSIQMLVEKTSE